MGFLCGCCRWCHAIKSLNKNKTQNTLDNDNSDKNKGSDGGVTGRAAGFRRDRRRPSRMADNPPDPHLFLLFLIFRFPMGLWRM